MSAFFGLLIFVLFLVAWLYPDKPVPTRTSWVYCPQCRHDLNGDDKSFVSDHDGRVTYRCASCGHVSLFDFARYPVPVCIEGSQDE